MFTPQLLDVCCCEGAASEGFRRAGFDVVGVDIAPQPNYPFTFIQADGLDFLARHGNDFDAIAVGPPCQDHSPLNFSNRIAYGTGWLLPAFLELLRTPRFDAVPWVVENVDGGSAAEHMPDAIKLCGSAFGLDNWRHRLFVSNVLVMSPGCWHSDRIPSYSRNRTYKPGRPALDRPWARPIAGHMGITKAREIATAWGAPWLSEYGVTQAIPPVYAEHIGHQLMPFVQESAGAGKPRRSRKW